MRTTPTWRRTPIRVTDTEPPITVDGLTHRYPLRKRSRRGGRHARAASEGRGAAEDRPALQDVCLEVQAGEVFGVLGPNGGGKSTLFRILATMLEPTKGSVTVFGHDVRTEPDAVRRQLGVVFQMPSLDLKLTARENLRHHGHLYGMSGSRLSEQLHHLLEYFGLADRGDDLVEHLSGGLRRRLELAKALLHRPRLLLLDEPSTGLDPAARLDLWQQFTRLRHESGVSVALTTHLMDEADRCDRLAILARGKLVAMDRPAKLKDRIGGDVITVELDRSDAPEQEPESTRQLIENRFGPWPDNTAPTVIDGRIRFEKPEGAAVVATLAASLPDQIRSITIGRPTLDDVFLHLTGHGIWEDEG